MSHDKGQQKFTVKTSPVATSRKPFLTWLTAGSIPRLSEYFPNMHTSKGIQAPLQFARNAYNCIG